MSELAFFLGCIIPNRMPEVELAARLASEKLGITLRDMDGASCCPAPGVMKSFDQKLWLKLAARNLSIADTMGDDIVTLCNGCYGTLKDTSMELREDEALLASVRESLAPKGYPLNAVPDVYHFVEYLYYDYGIDAIKERVEHTLSCNVAVHYGCHLLKPVKYRKEKNFETPAFFDELVEATGAKSIPYAEKSSCCGAGGGLRSGIKDLSLDIAKKKVASIHGADCIVTPCPFCHMQLAQAADIPVLHYAQLLAISLGVDPKAIGVEMVL